MDDEITEEVFEMIKRIAGVYEALPPDSVALVLSLKEDDEQYEEDEKVDTSLFREQVLINVIDNLPEGSEDSVVFSLTHGILEMIEENFDDLIRLGKNRISYLSLEKGEDSKSEATIIKFSDYKKKLH
jgi:hypothetical protein